MDLTEKQLNDLYRKGWITHKPKMQIDINRKVKELMRINGLNKTQAVLDVSVSMGVSRSTVWIALRACNS